MAPLDLAKSPPRSPRVELRGLCMLPRMIDIARATLPGGSVGEYQIGRGMSGTVFNAFGVSAPEFVEMVRGASSDDDVAQRLWSHGGVPVAALSRRLRGLRVADVPDDLRADFQRFYGCQHPPDRCLFDILEADDARMFPKRA
jgi:hypothetical protein